jgi:thiosulfate/3-mercaptopyruvate sulfurtransferase
MPTARNFARPFAAIVSLGLLVTTSPAPLAAQDARAARAARAELVVTPAWLASRLADPRVVILHVPHDDDYEAGHIPGARKADYGSFVIRREAIASELPPAEVLRAAFERLGVSDSTTVVVYAHEAPMATRVLYSLAAIGHERFAFLDGGLDRWRAEGRPTSKDVPTTAAGHMTVRPMPPVVVDAAWITERLGKPGLALVDTRTDGEYNGTGNRSGMPSAGHLAGARQLEWQDMFTDGMIALKPRAELERAFAALASPGDTVVTYCWVGYRASATWFVARYLGYDAKLYDGSYQDWLQRKLPTTAGEQP